jgi:hypothetical protein
MPNPPNRSRPAPLFAVHALVAQHVKWAPEREEKALHDAIMRMPALNVGALLGFLAGELAWRDVLANRYPARDWISR